MDHLECVVIGCGVIGLSIARELQLTGINTLLLDKEDYFGKGTSSRNSEVIHAGIYYPESSLKAKFCVEGNRLLYEYCLARDIPHKKIGKLIVAVNDDEIPSLESYFHRAKSNGVKGLQWLNSKEVTSIEPNIKCAKGLLSPNTGIIDSHSFMQSLFADFCNSKGTFSFRSEVCSIRYDSGKFYVKLSDGFTFSTRILINSAGLLAPNLYNFYPSENLSLDIPKNFCIGHYYLLNQRSPFNRLIYPVAVPGGLGTHVTLDLANSVKFGPDVRWIDNLNYDFDDSHRNTFINSIKRYYPMLDSSKLVPGYTGIRPKISKEGMPDQDFLIIDSSISCNCHFISLLGIESPGLTSSLAIGKHVRGMLT